MSGISSRKTRRLWSAIVVRNCGGRWRACTRSACVCACATPSRLVSRLLLNNTNGNAATANHRARRTDNEATPQPEIRRHRPTPANQRTLPVGCHLIGAAGWQLPLQPAQGHSTPPGTAQLRCATTHTAGGQEIRGTQQVAGGQRAGVGGNTTYTYIGAGAGAIARRLPNIAARPRRRRVRAAGWWRRFRIAGRQQLLPGLQGADSEDGVIRPCTVVLCGAGRIMS